MGAIVTIRGQDPGSRQPSGPWQLCYRVTCRSLESSPMRIHAYAGGPKLCRQPPYLCSAHIVLTLREPVTNTPLAGVSVQLWLGEYMTWTLDTSEDGIVCLAFEEVSSKDKFYDPLSIAVKGFARVRVPYGLYRDARFDKTFYFPPPSSTARTRRPSPRST
ncbi:MAG: hypothetical protein QM784_25350 [Polyangiaceae bacterium]